MGKRVKRVLAVALVIVISIMSVSCKKNKEEETKEIKSDNDSIKIGVSFDSFVIERWRRDADVFVSRVNDYDSKAEVSVQNANGKIEKQKSQIRFLIDKKVDVLVVVCIDSEEIGDVIKEAKDAGIPVIAYDRLIMNSNVDLYISFDNEQVGRLMGEALVDAGHPNNKMLMISGPDNDNNVSMVNNGFMDVMKENDIEIVDKYSVEGWNAQKAADYIFAHEDELEDIDGIMCGNDSIATSVVKSLAELKLADKIHVVGQDADLEACQRIVEGTQVMTVYKQVEKLAEKAAEFAIKLARDKKIEGVTDTISDGKNDVPYYFLDSNAVNKDNIDKTIIESGFHRKEDVYLNVFDSEKETELTTELETITK